MFMTSVGHMLSEIICDWNGTKEVLKNLNVESVTRTAGVSLSDGL